LGEHDKIVILSVTEGEDKPLKYPATFSRAGLVIINKIDLLQYVQFDIGKAKQNVQKVHPTAEFWRSRRRRARTWMNGTRGWRKSAPNARRIGPRRPLANSL
jgi:Ni2+-binding GTPase involved in maturation of urease and hydrogenase